MQDLPEGVSRHPAHKPTNFESRLLSTRGPFVNSACTLRRDSSFQDVKSQPNGENCEASARKHKEKQNTHAGV